MPATHAPAPTGNPDIFRQFLPQIHAATDAIINLTTGGSPEMSPEERLAAALDFSPEWASSPRRRPTLARCCR